MEKLLKIFTVSVIAVFILNINTYSQEEDRFYTENSGELIFSFADVSLNGQELSTPLRFSLFFHAGNNIHFDLNDYVGIYSGWALRNIGFITEENNVKMKRRTYSIGIPAAIKLGSFKNNFFLYGGASYEMFFHYKQKQFVNGDKSKYSEWFSDRTERFAPSFFAGVQFPKGINLKFKYYPNDFLNRSFVGKDFGQDVDYGDFGKTKLFYIALTFNFKPEDFGIKKGSESDQVKFASFRK